MTYRGPPFPECCRYCPYRTPVSGVCGHDARQSLVQEFAGPVDDDRPCPVFDEVRAGAMAALSERLAGASPSDPDG